MTVPMPASLTVAPGAAPGAAAAAGAAPGAAAVLAGLREQLGSLRRSELGAAPRDWDPAAREAAIGELDAMIQELTIFRGQVLLAHRSEGRWGSVGDRDFADWRSRVTGVGRGAATRQVELADGLTAMPQVAGAVERGELTLEHATTLARLRRQASPEVQGALDAGTLDELVEHATREGLSAPQLDKVAKRRAAQIDAEAAQRSFDAVRRRRSLTMRNHSGGVKGEFFLDPVAGAELRTALDAITGKPAKNDDRTREQRMADALSTMAGRGLQVGSDLNGAQIRPHISLLVAQETWAGIRARRRAVEEPRRHTEDQSCGSGTPAEPRGASALGGPPPLPAVAPAELEDGTIVPLGELERIMCDCEVTRVVMDADSAPLDVGRTQRTYTKELRRAVTTRDRHCQWPTCQLRASWCEVHHITWFSRGGHTSLAEGITLCNYHHHRVHEHDIRITVLPDGFDFHHPHGHRIGTTRRNGPQPTRSPSAAPLRSEVVPCVTAVRPVGVTVRCTPTAPRTPSDPARTSPPMPAAVATGSPPRRRSPAPRSDPGDPARPTPASLHPVLRRRSAAARPPVPEPPPAPEGLKWRQPAQRRHHVQRPPAQRRSSARPTGVRGRAPPAARRTRYHRRPPSTRRARSPPRGPRPAGTAACGHPITVP